MKWVYSISLTVAFAIQPVYGNAVNAPHTLTPKARHVFVTNLLKKMTLDEKIGQLRLISVGSKTTKTEIRDMIQHGQIGAIFNTVTRQDIRAMQDQQMQLSRLKIPLFFAYDVVHGQRTAFPIPLGLAASWDLDAVAQAGRISAYEAADDGLNMTWAPMVDVTREPRWGRVSEGFGEDTFLTSIMSRTLVASIQGTNPAERHSLMTSVKHFAAYGAIEGGRDYNTVDMSMLRLHQDYLPPYKAALDVGSAGVMVALNSLNGIPATANRWLLKDILRDEWQFKGITISDHGAIKELIKHGVASDPQDAVRIAIKSGIDMSMSDEYYSHYLPTLVKSGAVSQQEIDNATRHVLNVKYDMGLFKDPYNHLGSKESDPVDTNAESRLHRNEARDIARKSVVLLKNQHKTLPLKKSGTIALIGPLADNQRDIIGSWSAAAVANQAVTLRQGMENAIAGKATLLYAKGANITDNTKTKDFLNQYENVVDSEPLTPQQMLKDAVATAQQADVVVVAVGEARGMVHEASSQSDITLPPNQLKLLEALRATGKPLVMVLMNGRPLALVQEYQQVDALLETWFSGTEGGNAITDVLFGDYNPSGKLPMSFPRSVGQLPIYYNHLNTGRPYNSKQPNKYTSHYYDAINGPLFPFGYGLSYTTFNVSSVQLSASTMPHNGKIIASVTVTNTGDVEGATVVQMYLHDHVATISRPVKELKGFKRIMLKAGESKKVSFSINADTLKFWNAHQQWVAESGNFSVMIGLDSVSTQNTEFRYL